MCSGSGLRLPISIRGAKVNTGVKVNTGIFDQFERGDPLGIPQKYELKTRKCSRLRCDPKSEESQRGSPFTLGISGINFPISTEIFFLPNQSRAKPEHKS